MRHAACGLLALVGAIALPAGSAGAGTCVGQLIPAPGALILPPAVPQPLNANDIVGLNIQNTGASATGARIMAFGQVFAPGRVQPSDALVANIGGAAYAVQLDALAAWPDGSVKLGSISLSPPSICAAAQVGALLSKAVATDPPLPPSLLSFAATPVQLTASLSFTSGGYTGVKFVDLGAALARKPSYWFQGPLASQARVDIPLPGGPMHITADVTVYADGAVSADVQFNDDLTTTIPASGGINPQPPLAPLQYSATIALQGHSVVSSVVQDQYADWHSVLWSNGAPSLNFQHDVAYLEATGAVLPYDLATGVSDATLATFVGPYLNPYNPAYGTPCSLIITPESPPCNPSFGAPLSSNGVTMQMPAPGGRADLGYTTLVNTAWIVTQDARAAALASLQADAAGAAPWNWKLASGRWLTPADDASIWTSEYGGPQGYADGIQNYADWTSWHTDPAHQPNLNYVPYLMTATRWNLDRLNAQAAFNLSNLWPGWRCVAAAKTCGGLNDILIDGDVGGGQEIRGQAWGIREIQEAAFIGRPGTFDQAYFDKVANDNWRFVRTTEPSLAAAGGEAYGYELGNYGGGVIPEWEEDYLTGTAVLGARMGFSGAKQFVGWQIDHWLAGRFIAPDMNPYDGCAYHLIVLDGAGAPFTTWAAIEAATIAAGASNGPGNVNHWAQSNGDYCALARAALSSALWLFPHNSKLKQALSWLDASGAPYIDKGSLQADPTFNVAPPP